MKTVIVLMLCVGMHLTSKAQSHEAQQLLLNWEKLAQLKGILRNMYKGYRVVSEGYTRVKNIAEGNYSLHQAFLDRLLEVSPEVRKYKKIGDVIAYQGRIMREQRQALTSFKSSGSFSPE